MNPLKYSPDSSFNFCHLNTLYYSLKNSSVKECSQIKIRHLNCIFPTSPVIWDSFHYIMIQTISVLSQYEVNTNSILTPVLTGSQQVVSRLIIG